MKQESPRQQELARAVEDRRLCRLQEGELSSVRGGEVVTELRAEQRVEGKPGKHQGGALGRAGGQSGDAADGLSEELGDAPDDESVAEGELPDGLDTEQALGGDEGALAAVTGQEVLKEGAPAFVGACDE